MLKSGSWIEDNVIRGSLEDGQVQPAGVDLTVGEVYDLSEESTFELIGDDKVNRNREDVSPRYLGEQRAYELTEGWYVVRYNEEVAIPDNVVGFVFPRSTLMRNGTIVYSAVWDPGYVGMGVGGLYSSGRTLLGLGERISQIVFIEVRDSSGSYDGKYQGEGDEVIDMTGDSGGEN